MIGNLTKQFAQQAIGNQVNRVVDALRPADLPAIADALGDKGAAGAVENNLAATIVGQVQAMQKALKENEELVVLCTAAAETLRILEIFIPSADLLVLTGIDADKTITRVITPVATLQLVCKPMAAPAGASPTKVRIIAPRPKQP